MKLQIVCPDKALMPTRAHATDAGLDLKSGETAVVLKPGERRLVDTGVKVAIPAGYVGLVHPRSGHAHKYGITVNNAPGTIDSGYVGNILVNLINHGRETVALDYGDRIAQLLVQRVELPELELVDSLDTTTRGTAGHGSTGTGTKLAEYIRAISPSPTRATTWDSLIDQAATKAGVGMLEILDPILRTIVAGKATLADCRQLEAKGIPLSENFKRLAAAGNADADLLGIALTTFVATGNHEGDN